MIRLKHGYLHAQVDGQQLQLLIYALQSPRTVNFRFTYSQEIQVRASYYLYSQLLVLFVTVVLHRFKGAQSFGQEGIISSQKPL